jgi:hypothetical protein
MTKPYIFSEEELEFKNDVTGFYVGKISTIPLVNLNVGSLSLRREVITLDSKSKAQSILNDRTILAIYITIDDYHLINSASYIEARKQIVIDGGYDYIMEFDESDYTATFYFTSGVRYGRERLSFSVNKHKGSLNPRSVEQKSCDTPQDAVVQLQRFHYERLSIDGNEGRKRAKV